MRKKYLKLTQEQKERGVIFSSQLKKNVTRIGDREDSVIHEVFENDLDKELKIERLKDDDFFNPSHFDYNEIRQ